MPSETWIIYYDRNYAAGPWPYAKSWEEFSRAPGPLVDAVDDFGRVSPCDGLSETPTVPANLPRGKPRGTYRLAVYHDPDFLYVILEAQDGPHLVAADQLRAIPHLAGVEPLPTAVVIPSVDERWNYRFGVNAQGEPEAQRHPALYGPRRATPPAAILQWDFRRVTLVGSEWTFWRIARSSIADALDGATLRLSVARACFYTLESVAWGSQATWAQRPDEMGLVRLVARRPLAPWPRLRRIECDYDPLREQGRLRLLWSDFYRPEEEQNKPPSWPSWPLQPPDHWYEAALHVNTARRLLPLQETAESDWLPIADGWNRVRVATSGGPATEVYFEKRSGNRIAEPPLPAKPWIGNERIRTQIHAECAAVIRGLEERRASGEPLEFRRWATYQAASCGRAYHYVGEDPRLLDVLRDEADCALRLQRPDGTYAGFHLAAHGRQAGVWAGGAYDTGPAGELWVVAAWLLKQPHYLEASRRLVAAYRSYPVEFNHNYAAFALYHLAAHYRLTGEAEALRHGLYYAEHCAGCDILPLGFQGGHNYYSCYGAITLRGLAQFCLVLPDSEPFKPVLRERCIRMANQVISRMLPDGLYDARDRFYIGRSLWLWGLFSAAFLVEKDDCRRIDGVVCRMLHCPPATWGTSPTACLCESDFIRYFAHRERLLAGARIDPLTLF
jgi:hypothetical protein